MTVSIKQLKSIICLYETIKNKTKIITKINYVRL